MPQAPYKDTLPQLELLPLAKRSSQAGKTITFSKFGTFMKNRGKNMVKGLKVGIPIAMAVDPEYGKQGVDLVKELDPQFIKTNIDIVWNLIKFGGYGVKGVFYDTPAYLIQTPNEQIIEDANNTWNKSADFTAKTWQEIQELKAQDFVDAVNWMSNNMYDVTAHAMQEPFVALMNKLDITDMRLTRSRDGIETRVWEDEDRKLELTMKTFFFEDSQIYESSYTNKKTGEITKYRPQLNQQEVFIPGTGTEIVTFTDDEMTKIGAVQRLDTNGNVIYNWARIYTEDGDETDLWTEEHYQYAKNQKGESYCTASRITQKSDEGLIVKDKRFDENGNTTKNVQKNPTIDGYILTDYVNGIEQTISKEDETTFVITRKHNPETNRNILVSIATSSDDNKEETFVGYENDEEVYYAVKQVNENGTYTIETTDHKTQNETRTEYDAENRITSRDIKTESGQYITHFDKQGNVIGNKQLTTSGTPIMDYSDSADTEESILYDDEGRKKSHRILHKTTNITETEIYEKGIIRHRIVENPDKGITDSTFYLDGKKDIRYVKTPTQSIDYDYAKGEGKITDLKSKQVKITHSETETFKQETTGVLNLLNHAQTSNNALPDNNMQTASQNER